MKNAAKKPRLRSLGWVLTALIALGWAVSGCIPSIHPLYTAKDLIYDKALLGTWKDKDEGSDSWIFEPDGETGTGYKVTIRGDSDSKKDSPMDGRLLRLKEHRFLNLTPSKEPLSALQTGPTYALGIVRAHLFFHVVQIEPKLKMRVLDYDWLEDELLKKPQPIAARVEKGELIVLTAPTAELQAFVLKHIDNDEAWSDPSDMARQTEKATKP